MKINMKTNLSFLCGAVIAAGVLLAGAGEMPKAKPGSVEFEQMKTLVGTWTGKTDMGDGPVDITVRYRLVAAGSVIEERIFEGTPHEMVTMYYDQDGKLALTHYCALGNRPAMKLKSSDNKTLAFDFDPKCGINPKKESHMHALKISFVDKNTITTSCQSFMEGKESPECSTTLKRSET